MENEIRLAFEGLLASGSGTSEPSYLAIIVVFTTVVATMAAMRKAVELASELNARIALVVPQVVPYPLPLSSPPVLLGFNENRFRRIAGATPVETVVRLYLCRDREAVLKTALPRQSLVVVGGRQRWWPTAEKRLARRLQGAGHDVVYVETE